MLGAPHVRAVRGFSDFGYSFVYVIFEDGTDTYWARTRTLEYLSGVLSRLPPDARTELGPTEPRGFAVVPGLEPPLPPEVGAWRVRGGLARRVRPAVPGERGPEPAA